MTGNTQQKVPKVFQHGSALIWPWDVSKSCVKISCRREHVDRALTSSFIMSLTTGLDSWCGVRLLPWKLLFHFYHSAGRKRPVSDSYICPIKAWATWVHIGKKHLLMKAFSRWRDNDLGCECIVFLICHFHSVRLWFSVLLKTYWLIILIYLSKNWVRIDLGPSALKPPILWTSFSWLPPAVLSASQLSWQPCTSLWFVNVNFIKYQYSLLNLIQMCILWCWRWDTSSWMWLFWLFLDDIFFSSLSSYIKEKKIRKWKYLLIPCKSLLGYIIDEILVWGKGPFCLEVILGYTGV